MVNDRKIDFKKDPNSIKSLNLLHELQNLIKWSRAWLQKVSNLMKRFQICLHKVTKLLKKGPELGYIRVPDSAT